MPFGYAPAFLFRERCRPGNQGKDQHIDHEITAHDAFGQATVELDQAEADHGNQDEQPGQQETDLLQAKLLLEQGGKRPAEARRNLCQRPREDRLQARRQAQLARGPSTACSRLETGISPPVNDRAVEDDENDGRALPTACVHRTTTRSQAR